MKKILFLFVIGLIISACTKNEQPWEGVKVYTIDSVGTIELGEYHEVSNIIAPKGTYGPTLLVNYYYGKEKLTPKVYCYKGVMDTTDVILSDGKEIKLFLKEEHSGDYFAQRFNLYLASIDSQSLISTSLTTSYTLGFFIEDGGEKKHLRTLHLDF
jgi:hypothetical protein